MYRTTDVDVRSSLRLHLLINSWLEDHCILHHLASLFPSSHRLVVEDLFVVKYDATVPGHQTSLNPHRDDSEVSFVMNLAGSWNHGGGGTEFVQSGLTLGDAPHPGLLWYFCGRMLHRGRPITTGTRYILTGFVRVKNKAIRALIQTSIVNL